MRHSALFQREFKKKHRKSNVSALSDERSTLVALLLPPRGRFTKYLTTVSQLSYDNAKVTIELR